MPPFDQGGEVLEAPGKTLVPERREEGNVKDVNLISGHDPFLREPNDGRRKQKSGDCRKEGTKVGDQECNRLRVLAHELGEPRTPRDAVAAPDHSENDPRPRQHDDRHDQRRDV